MLRKAIVDAAARGVLEWNASRARPPSVQDGPVLLPTTLGSGVVEVSVPTSFRAFRMLFAQLIRAARPAGMLPDAAAGKPGDEGDLTDRVAEASATEDLAETGVDGDGAVVAGGAEGMVEDTQPAELGDDAALSAAASPAPATSAGRSRPSGTSSRRTAASSGREGGAAASVPASTGGSAGRDDASTSDTDGAAVALDGAADSAAGEISVTPGVRLSHSAEDLEGAEAEGEKVVSASSATAAATPSARSGRAAGSVVEAGSASAAPSASRSTAAKPARGRKGSSRGAAAAAAGGAVTDVEGKDAEGDARVIEQIPAPPLADPLWRAASKIVSKAALTPFGVFVTCAPAAAAAAAVAASSAAVEGGAGAGSSAAAGGAPGRRMSAAAVRGRSASSAPRAVGAGAAGVSSPGRSLSASAPSSSGSVLASLNAAMTVDGVDGAGLMPHQYTRLPAAEKKALQRRFLQLPSEQRAALVQAARDRLVAVAREVASAAHAELVVSMPIPAHAIGRHSGSSKRAGGAAAAGASGNKRGGDAGDSSSDSGVAGTGIRDNDDADEDDDGAARRGRAGSRGKKTSGSATAAAAERPPRGDSVGDRDRLATKLATAPDGSFLDPEAVGRCLFGHALLSACRVVHPAASPANAAATAPLSAAGAAAGAAAAKAAASVAPGGAGSGGSGRGRAGATPGKGKKGRKATVVADSDDDDDDNDDDGDDGSEGETAAGKKSKQSAAARPKGKVRAPTTATASASARHKDSTALSVPYLPRGAFQATLSTVVGPLPAAFAEHRGRDTATGGAGAATSSSGSAWTLSPAAALASAALRTAAGQVADLMRVLPGLTLRKRVGSVTGVAGGFSLVAEPAAPEVMISFTPATTLARMLAEAATSMDPGSVNGVVTVRLLYACRAVKTATLEAELAALDAAGATASLSSVEEKAAAEDAPAKRKRYVSPRSKAAATKPRTKQRRGK